MQKHLYFICPTDHLETIIEKTFNQEHYFYTSLANSVVLNPETVGQINGIVESKNIKQITFLLSRENDIIQGVLKNQDFLDIKGMCKFYHIVNNQLGNLNLDQKIEDIELQLISNYLNKKIKEFRSVLSKWLIEDISINALIYYPHHNVFIEAKPALLQFNRFYLN